MDDTPGMNSKVDVICMALTNSLVQTSKAIEASPAEILTALLKTTHLYAGYSNKPILSNALRDITEAYENTIAEAREGRPPLDLVDSSGKQIEPEGE